MAISSMNFPLLTPDQAAPFLTGMQKGLNAAETGAQTQMYQQNANLTAQQVPYAGYQAYGDAMMKMNQANWLPVTNAVQIATSPFIGATNPGLQQSMINQLPALYKQAQMGGMAIPQPGQMNNYSNPGLLSQIGGGIRSLFGQGQSPQQNQIPQNGSSQPLPPWAMGQNPALSSGGPSMQQGGSSTQPQQVNIPGTNSYTDPSTYSSLVGQIQNMQPGDSYVVPGNQGGGNNNSASSQASVGSSPSSAYNQNTPASMVSTNITQPLFGNKETGRGAGVGQGTTYFDLKDGAMTSSPTNTTTSIDQSQISATKRLFPIMQRMADESSPFMSYGGQFNYLKSVAEGDSGSQASKDLVSQHAALESDWNTYPESMLKAYGVPVTDKSVSDMKDTLPYQWGENEQSYKNRIYTKMQQLKAEELAPAEQQLSSGIKLNSTTGQNQTAAQQSAASTMPSPSVASGQVPAPGTGSNASDGTSTVIPIGPHQGKTAIKKNGAWYLT